MKENYTGIYIMGNDRPTLYIGVSNNIVRRVAEHKQGKTKGFTQRYGLNKLLYYEFISSITEAIYREKVLKRFLRKEKLDLIRTPNPMLADISNELFQYIDNWQQIETYEP